MQGPKIELKCSVGKKKMLTKPGRVEYKRKGRELFIMRPRRPLVHGTQSWK